MTEKQLQKQREKEEKAAAKLAKEIERTEAMMTYERRFSDRAYICGIDEVGRGPLAGPVVACAVILPKDEQILYLNDSKKLSEKKRNMLYDVIMEKAVSVGIGIIPYPAGDLRGDAGSNRTAHGQAGYPFERRRDHPGRADRPGADHRR